MKKNNQLGIMWKVLHLPYVQREIKSNEKANKR
jgi:hypothetical protein